MQREALSEEPLYEVRVEVRAPLGVLQCRLRLPQLERTRGTVAAVRREIDRERGTVKDGTP